GVRTTRLAIPGLEAADAGRHCGTGMSESGAGHHPEARIAGTHPPSRSEIGAMDVMRRAAIFVQPSFFEELPLALQEAMFSGCACIGTRISGNDEIITYV